MSMHAVTDDLDNSAFLDGALAYSREHFRDPRQAPLGRRSGCTARPCAASDVRELFQSQRGRPAVVGHAAVTRLSLVGRAPAGGPLVQRGQSGQQVAALGGEGVAVPAVTHDASLAELAQALGEHAR